MDKVRLCEWSEPQSNLIRYVTWEKDTLPFSE